MKVLAVLLCVCYVAYAATITQEKIDRIHAGLTTLRNKASTISSYVQQAYARNGEDNNDAEYLANGFFGDLSHNFGYIGADTHFTDVVTNVRAYLNQLDYLTEAFTVESIPKQTVYGLYIARAYKDLLYVLSLNANRAVASFQITNLAEPTFPTLSPRPRTTLGVQGFNTSYNIVSTAANNLRDNNDAYVTKFNNYESHYYNYFSTSLGNLGQAFMNLFEVDNPSKGREIYNHILDIVTAIQQITYGLQGISNFNNDAIIYNVSATIFYDSLADFRKFQSYVV